MICKQNTYQSFLLSLICKLSLLEVDDWGLTLPGAAFGGGTVQKPCTAIFDSEPMPDQMQLVCSERASRIHLIVSVRERKIQGPTPQASSSTLIPASCQNSNYQNSMTFRRSRKVLPPHHRGPVRTQLLIKRETSLFINKDAQMKERSKSPGPREIEN